MAGGVEEGVGVVGGEALVEEVVGEVGVGFLQGECEGLGFGGLGARCAVGVERVADQEDFDVVLADEAGDGLEVGSEGSAVERKRGWAVRPSGSVMAIPMRRSPTSSARVRG